jgi:SAM-dependent methyltransferase
MSNRIEAGWQQVSAEQKKGTDLYWQAPIFSYWPGSADSFFGFQEQSLISAGLMCPERRPAHVIAQVMLVSNPTFALGFYLHDGNEEHLSGMRLKLLPFITLTERKEEVLMPEEPLVYGLRVETNDDRQVFMPVDVRLPISREGLQDFTLANLLNFDLTMVLRSYAYNAEQSLQWEIERPAGTIYHPSTNRLFHLFYSWPIAVANALWQDDRFDPDKINFGFPEVNKELRRVIAECSYRDFNPVESCSLPSSFVDLAYELVIKQLYQLGASAPIRSAYKVQSGEFDELPQKRIVDLPAQASMIYAIGQLMIKLGDQYGMEFDASLEDRLWQLAAVSFRSFSPDEHVGIINLSKDWREWTREEVSQMIIHLMTLCHSSCWYSMTDNPLDNKYFIFSPFYSRLPESLEINGQTWRFYFGHVLAADWLLTDTENVAGIFDIIGPKNYRQMVQGFDRSAVYSALFEHPLVKERLVDSTKIRLLDVASAIAELAVWIDEIPAESDLHWLSDAEIYCFDMSKAMNIEAERQPGVVMAQQGDIQDLVPYMYLDRFDVVVATYLLHYLHDREAALRNMRQAVRRGGVALFAIRRPGKGWEEEYRMLLQDAGFSDEIIFFEGTVELQDKLNRGEIIDVPVGYIIAAA